MEPEIKDVKPGSSAGNGVKVESPSTDELAKLKADNERMGKALSNLQSERDEIRAEVDELREIKRQYGELTKGQQARMNELKREGASLDERLGEWRKNLLRQNPDAENWFTDVDMKLAKATKTSVNEAAGLAALERAGDLLEELADDLSDEAEKDESMKDYKSMTDEKLLKLIKPYMGQFETKSPYIKTKKAFKAWKADLAFKREKAEANKKKAEETLSQENGTRSTRETTAQDIYNKKGDLNTSDKAMLRQQLGIMHRAK